MSLKNSLAAASEQADREFRRLNHPKGWEAGIELDGDTGVVTTEPLKDAPDWGHVLKVWGLDPTLYEIVGSPQMRAWDAQTKDGIERLYYYRANIARKGSRVDIDDLVRQIRKNRRKPLKTVTDDVFVFPLGDTQIGEWNAHGGTETLVARFVGVCEAALAQLKVLRRLGRVGGDVLLPWLGDCLQGFQVQNGRLAWRTDLTMTEQFRVYRRLLALQVEMFAPYCERLTVVGIPGNHDEALRSPVVTRGDDSWAVEGVVAVADAFKRVEGYDHVSFVTPKIDGLTVTVDANGTVIGMAHGHQFNGDASKAHLWWAKQAHGRTNVGDADLLLLGHRHHLYVQEGGAKTVLQVPALAGESSWWVERAGDRGSASAVCFTAGGGYWGNLSLL